jgi:hypothetical protein
MRKKQQFDLVTFVAGDAVKAKEVLFLKCNCSGVITVMPPLQEELVVCPVCESRIRILVIDGDPGYIAGLGSDGKTPMLFPVQGSKAPPLTGEEREAALRRIEESMRDRKPNKKK